MPRDPQEILSEIHHLIEEYFESAPPVVPPGRLPLAVPTYGSGEVNEALDALLSTNVTMGERVRSFELEFAQYLGASEAIMVNSGSSANLLALSVLANPASGNPLRPGDEVIVPAVTWPTTIWPVIQVGAVPVLVDVSLETLCLDIAAVERAIGPRTRAIVPVHLLGNACDLRALQSLCRKHDLLLVEDTCEALGTRYGERFAGTFGEFGTYSFYFSHHMTTIEGGMLVTSDPHLAELARVLRAHGWVRDMKDQRAAVEKNPRLDPRFLFVNIGFNLRPTEIQGAFGLHQLRRLGPFARVRARNAACWTDRLSRYPDWIHLTRPEKGALHSWFAFPVLVKAEAPFARKDLQDFLESRGVDTRPIVAGNLAEQPALGQFEHRVEGELGNARAVMERGFFFGNHGLLVKEQCEQIADIFDEFIQEYQ